jgi:metal-responsive CopG/Arc/MetJ family transcriptional regulator
MAKREREKVKGEKVTVTIPRWILESIEEVAEEIEGSRSDVVVALLAHCFQDEGDADRESIMDTVFPYEEDDQGQKP